MSSYATQSKEALQDASAVAERKASALASDAKQAVQIGTDDPNAWVPQYSGTDYVRFFSSGALCATITHGAMTPVDVVKTRLQLEPKGSTLRMASMARHIVTSEGPAGLMTGFGPTAVGE